MTLPVELSIWTLKHILLRLRRPPNPQLTLHSLQVLHWDHLDDEISWYVHFKNTKDSNKTYVEEGSVNWWAASAKPWNCVCTTSHALTHGKVRHFWLWDKSSEIIKKFEIRQSFGTYILSHSVSVLWRLTILQVDIATYTLPLTYHQQQVYPNYDHL